MLFTARLNWSELDSPVRLAALTAPLRSPTRDDPLQELVVAAAQRTGFAHARVSLVLERTQLVRAHHGLPPEPAHAQETARQHGFCQYVVAGGEELEVCDAQGESQLPQEVRSRGVRAYVGVPLRVRGQVVGSFCVMDGKPRVLLAQQRLELRALAARAERRLAELGAQPPGPSASQLLERMRAHMEVARRARAALQAGLSQPAAPQASGPSAPPPRNASAHAPEVVYQHALEGLFEKGLKGRVTPALEARLRPLGLDLSRPFEATYPRRVYEDVLQVTARELWPALPPERAHFELGRCLVTGYAHTLLGRSILSMTRMVGPRATLGRMQHNLRTGSNYSCAGLTEDGPGRCRLWVNEPELDPGFVQGLLDAVLEYAGAQGRRVSLRARDAQGCTYDVAWEA